MLMQVIIIAFLLSMLLGISLVMAAGLLFLQALTKEYTAEENQRDKRAIKKKQKQVIVI